MVRGGLLGNVKLDSLEKMEAENFRKDWQRERKHKCEHPKRQGSDEKGKFLVSNVNMHNKDATGKIKRANPRRALICVLTLCWIDRALLLKCHDYLDEIFEVL
ncbi:unnamed protein product [Hermetia illucens]|uniref:Uncharacterized protein n=1 Tax=Hermetia illucens TaxID=343691 RepID=A0A7R8UIH2_HERIL|nr:unnamed protein product [Hermetia illucens]